MVQKRWELCNENPALADRIAAALGIKPVTAQILVNRGITTIEEARQFFDFDLNNLWDPFLFSDMDMAISRLLTAIQSGERMVIFGDYDVDGITGTSLLWRVLRKAGANADYTIPDRSEGYGMNLQAVERLASGGYTLIITVDNGISSCREVELANVRGIDVIVTDHHEPPEVIPPALAVINPKMAESGYPFPYLAGVGVGFKLCQALAIRLASEALAQYVLEQLDLVTLGTIADIVPILGENRLIAANGLRLLQQTHNIGIKALIEVAELKGEITSGHIGFMLGPRINAIGRMDNPCLGVELLTTDDPEYARELASKLDQANRKRQMLEETIVKSAIDQIETTQMAKSCGLVLASEDWHHGIIGIAASKLVDRYYRPTILIALHDGVGKGSARSIRGLHLYEALNHCKEYLIGFGGHDMAAGLSIAPEQIKPFMKAFQEYVESVLHPDDLIPYLKVDTRVSLDELNFDLLAELERLEPHGPGNSRPVLQVSRVLHQHNLVGATGDHLKLQVFNDSQRVGGIGFGMARKSIELNESSHIDVVFHLERNVWKNQENLQMMISDLRPSELGFVERLYREAENYLKVSTDVTQSADGEPLRQVRDKIMQQAEEAVSSDEGTVQSMQHLQAGKNLLLVSNLEDNALQVMLSYSTYLALQTGKSICIFYPQRFLLERQFTRLKRSFADRGLTAAFACGSRSKSEMMALEQAITKDTIDVLFTTPAYLSAHLEKFKIFIERLGCCILQEAQQMHQTYDSFTLGYGEFDTLWQRMGRPQIFAHAESLEEARVAELASRFAIQEVMGAPQIRTNLTIEDQRQYPDKLAYVQNLLGKGEKTLIVVNTAAGSVEVAKRLLSLIKKEEGVLYYHEGLPLVMQQEVLARLTRGESMALVANAVSAGQFNVTDFRHVVIYDLCLHYSEFLAQCRLAGMDGQKSVIHLLYNTGDRKQTEEFLEITAPERELLVKVYLFIEKLADRKGEFTLDLHRIALQAGAPISPEGSAEGVENALWILAEMQLIDIVQRSEQWVIRLLPKPKQKLDLSSSIRYNEGIMDKKNFAAFCQVALQEKPEELLKRICQPAFPTRLKLRR